MVEEVLQFFGSMGTNRECVIHLTEPPYGLEGRPTDCHLLKVFHEEVGNDR